MFGVDLGISVSSVVCTTGEKYKYEILDYSVIFGNKSEPDNWKRVVEMSEIIIDNVMEICKSKPDVIIEPLVSVEEPILAYGTRNFVSYFNMCCLYTLVRNKLEKRGFTIYSINPVSAKATAKAMAFPNLQLNDEKLVKRGRLTKKGMVAAFKKVTGSIPSGSNNATRETIADSFFIAQTGISRKKVGVR